MRDRDFFHPALPEFARIAEPLCAVIRNDNSLSPSQQLSAIHELLPQAYAAALRLPSTDVLFGRESDPAEVPEEDVSPAAPDLRGLAGFLGTNCLYREIFDPNIVGEDQPVVGDLIDDITDIHGELAAGLAHWKAGNYGRALWGWRFGFEHHWAEHATSALRALFALSAWRDLPWPAGAG